MKTMIGNPEISASACRRSTFGCPGPPRRWTGTCGLLVVAFVLIGSFPACEQPPGIPTRNLADYRDASIKDNNNLGWIGAEAQPLNQPLSFSDPASPGVDVSPGGIVLVEIANGLPLDSAQLKPGDVIVRVANNWLPIKEDATLDFIKAVEDQINARKYRIEIGYFRAGRFETTELNTDLESLDEGLPLPVDRFSHAAQAALQQLADLQLEDGSFTVDSGDTEGKLMATAMSGLAFLAAGNSEGQAFAQPIESCLRFLGDRIDELQTETEPRPLDPLTAAWLGMFLAESDAPLFEDQWLERFGFVLDSLLNSQDVSGGWSVAEVVDDANDDDEKDNLNGRTVDVMGTFATSQVLMALGALERKELATENEAIEKGFSWLQEQSRLRIPGSIDRRVKSILSAGTAAALVVCNCDDNDVQLGELVKHALERAGDVYTAPQFGLSGFFLTALATRQSGNEAWLRFHNSIKHLAISLQRPDGRIVPYPGIKRAPLDFEERVAGEAWETAHVALVLSMQSRQLKRLLGVDTSESMVVRDSSGKVSTADADAGELEVDPNKANAEEIKKMILEQLREQGMEVDESDLKIESAKKPKDD